MCLFFVVNDISISDAETQSGNEHEPSDNVNDDVHVDAQPSNDNLETEPVVDLDNPQSKNQCYDNRDFVARKHGNHRSSYLRIKTTMIVRQVSVVLTFSRTGPSHTRFN